MKTLEPPVQTEKIPADSGAYFLEFGVQKSRLVNIGALGDFQFEPGAYRYCGSAYGPGGLAARLRRHLRSGTKTHWHVDYLAAEFPIVRIGFEVDGGECKLVSGLLDQAWRHTIEGLGTSDCSQCVSHLVYKPSND